MLTKYVSGSKAVDMQYDGKGIRVAKTRKIGTSVTTNSTYIYDNGGKLRTEIEGNTTRNYIYGQDGIVGYEENNEHFMYRKNIFGDVTAIYKGATKVAEYKYDAWGNCTIILNTSGYGSRNPFRYRGYYWDSDLGMYYLITRYYDPQTGRFINADTIEYLKPDKINGLNLYAYCGNNSIMNVDPTGHNLIAILAILLTACAIGLGMAAGYKMGEESSEIVEGNIDMFHPDQLPNPDKDNTELTDEQREMNALKGMFVGGYVGALSVAFLGAVLYFKDPSIGGALFVAGTLGTILLKPFLLSVGIEVETPELDPSDIYQPDLPQYK